MDLRTIRARRQVGQDLDRRLAAQVPAHPREAAIAYIRDALDAGLAGLDSYDATVLILDCHPFERVWANRALELTGMVVDSRMWFRAVLAADVFKRLGLAEADAPTLAEPLASRSLHSVPDRISDAEAVMDAVFAVLPGEPVSAQAIRDAKQAYDARVDDRSWDWGL